MVHLAYEQRNGRQVFFVLLHHPDVFLLHLVVEQGERAVDARVNVGRHPVGRLVHVGVGLHRGHQLRNAVRGFLNLTHHPLGNKHVVEPLKHRTQVLSLQDVADLLYFINLQAKFGEVLGNVVAIFHALIFQPVGHLVFPRVAFHHCELHLPRLIDTGKYEIIHLINLLGR